MILNERSVKALNGVHADLVKVIYKTAEISQLNFIVTEGLRSKERQKELFDKGLSKTMNSRHLTGHAVDLAVWFDYDEDKVVDSQEVSWKFEVYKALAAYVKEAAKLVNVPIEWGGDWVSFRDCPHFQLPRTKYN